MLTPRRVVLRVAILNLQERKVLPAGTPGLHVGRRTHFDLGYALQHGKGWLCGELPILQGLQIGVHLDDLGEWDGSPTGFTSTGWELNPIRQLRHERGSEPGRGA